LGNGLQERYQNHPEYVDIIPVITAYQENKKEQYIIPLRSRLESY